MLVVPLVGTWIETPILALAQRQKQSFPSWERGLKQGWATRADINEGVVPLVGTWIETAFVLTAHLLCSVVPLVGTWIETET